MKNIVGYRFLILGDNQNSIKRIKEIIDELSSMADTVGSDKDAMLYIDYFSYDLIFMEEDFIGSNYNLTLYISNSFFNSHTPVVLLGDEKRVQELKEKDITAEIIDVIPYSITKNELISLLNLYFKFIEREKNLKKRIKSVENDLKKQKEYFKNIVGKTNAGIIITDEEGIIQFINESGEQIFLRKKSELLCTPFGVIQGNEIKKEINIVRKNGEVGIGEITTVNTEWKGKPSRLILVNDITDHIRLQERLDQSRQKAQESDRLKSAFLANMSHEIRTPLNGILGFSRFLANDNLSDADKKQFSEIIETCGNHLLRIINDIIDIAQIESGQFILSETEFDIMTLMRELQNIYKVDKNIVTRNIELKFVLPDISSIRIRSDEARLKQVLFNILNNAAKFTDKGNITVDLRFEEPDKFMFYVKDTGIGIPADELTNIFEKFRQVEMPKERLNEGNGLGLPISKALVQLMGGEIWLESEQGKGSTFYFTIKAPIIQDFILPKEVRITEKKKSLFANRKILIVEDEEVNFLFIKSLLDPCETIILWAKDGAEAVEMAKKEDVDIILMDMKLPVKSGYEAVKEIRLAKPDIPIIAQTAYAMGGDREKILEAGCNDYISKPIKMRDLFTKMHHFIN